MNIRRYAWVIELLAASVVVLLVLYTINHTVIKRDNLGYSSLSRTLPDYYAQPADSVDVLLLGTVPTPAVAFLVGKYKADAGVMISASHNSAEFNGIKVFSGDGYKLPDDLEERVEAIVLDKVLTPTMRVGDDIGKVVYKPNSVKDYVDHLKSTVPATLASPDGPRTVAVTCVV